MPISRSENALAYWKINYLSAPSTSIDSERLFSLAGHGKRKEKEPPVSWRGRDASLCKEKPTIHVQVTTLSLWQQQQPKGAWLVLQLLLFPVAPFISLEKYCSTNNFFYSWRLLCVFFMFPLPAAFIIWAHLFYHSNGAFSSALLICYLF